MPWARNPYPPGAVRMEWNGVSGKPIPGGAAGCCPLWVQAWSSHSLGRTCAGRLLCLLDHPSRYKIRTPMSLQASSCAGISIRKDSSAGTIATCHFSNCFSHNILLFRQIALDPVSCTGPGMPTLLPLLVRLSLPLAVELKHQDPRKCHLSIKLSLFLLRLCSCLLS